MSRSRSIEGTRPIQVAIPLECLAPILGAAACVVITAVIWRSVSASQAMWPLPAPYLIELAALGIVAAYAFIRGGRTGEIAAWAIVGVLAAFCIVGAWSVGFLYLPITLIFGVVLITYDVRNRQAIAAHLGVCLIAGLAQAALMLSFIHSL